MMRAAIAAHAATRRAQSPRRRRRLHLPPRLAAAPPPSPQEPVESFFRFFGTPNMSDDADEEMEPEEVYELNEQIQMEMDVGFEIKNKIIPRAVEWFTGEAVEDDSDDEDDEDEDEVRQAGRQRGAAPAAV